MQQTTTRHPRRSFLALCTDGLLALIGVIIAVPAVAYILAPLRGKRGGAGSSQTFQAIASIDDLPIGEWKLLPLKVAQQDGWERKEVSHSVWVRRNSDAQNGISVLSPICPHLGCHVNWFPGKHEFICPCHGGTYNANGRYISGPPPRSMDPLQFQVHGGELYVWWQEFETGVPEEIPVTT